MLGTLPGAMSGGHAGCTRECIGGVCTRGSMATMVPGTVCRRASLSSHHGREAVFQTYLSLPTMVGRCLSGMIPSLPTKEGRLSSQQYPSFSPREEALFPAVFPLSLLGGGSLPSRIPSFSPKGEDLSAQHTLLFLRREDLSAQHSLLSPKEGGPLCAEFPIFLLRREGLSAQS